SMAGAARRVAGARHAARYSLAQRPTARADCSRPAALRARRARVSEISRRPGVFLRAAAARAVRVLGRAARYRRRAARAVVLHATDRFRRVRDTGCRSAGPVPYGARRFNGVVSAHRRWPADGHAAAPQALTRAAE